MGTIFTHYFAIFVLWVLHLTAAAAEPSGGKVFTPKIVTGLVDIFFPTPSSLLEPLTPQMLNVANQRFQVGVQHMLEKNDADAIVVFHDMIEKFPSLREPYNNLAILYARQNQFDKSRAALELMLRLHPKYKNGYETLGDVYAQMAKDSYNKAFLFNDGNDNAKHKLFLLKPLGIKETNTVAE